MAFSISFFSNFFNSHQLPVALELYGASNVSYCFVAMSYVDGLTGRACLNDEYPFVLKPYLSTREADEAMRHVFEDDIVIFGDMAGDESYVRARAKTGKPFFRYTERLLKRGDWWALMPPKRLRTFDRFNRYIKSPMYVLCASAFASRDLVKLGFPSDRCLKWGYFPATRMSNARGEHRITSEKWKLCSAQRLISWKRVDLQLKMAKGLKDLGLPFTLTIAGDGDCSEELKYLAETLDVTDCVNFVGGLTAEETASLMCDGDIFITTSNRKEGWGAGVNEAMAAGCALVASSEVGSAPYLIKPGINGTIFNSGDAEDLTRVVQGLMRDREGTLCLARAGQDVVGGLWGARSAADRLICIAEQYLSHGCIEPYSEGPLSFAEPMNDDWYLTEGSR